MADDLLGYLLGASDGAERDAIRKKLESDVELQAELQKLERQLAPLEAERWNIEPPVGLASRTCAMIFQRADQALDTAVANGANSQAGGTEQRPQFQLSTPPRGEHLESTRGWIRWSLADVCLAVGMSVAALCLLAPSILKSRELARINLCQDNLRSLGIAMPIWAGLSHGSLPAVPATGNGAAAGFYAPQLMRAGIVNEDSTFVCANSHLANKPFHVPAISTIYSAKGAELVQLQREMGGSYYASLGYVSSGELRSRRYRGSPRLAMLAESPRSHGSYQTWQAGNVMNVLFEDGHVERIFVPRARGAYPLQVLGKFAARWQDMFVSDRGQLEAGRTENDVVLGPSWAKPFPYAIEESLINDPTPMDVQSILQSMDPHSLNLSSVLEAPGPSSPYPWVLE